MTLGPRKRRHSINVIRGRQEVYPYLDMTFHQELYTCTVIFDIDIQRDFYVCGGQGFDTSLRHFYGPYSHDEAERSASSDDCDPPRPYSLGDTTRSSSSQLSMARTGEGTEDPADGRGE